MPTCDSQNLSMHHTFHCYINVLLIKMSGNKVLKQTKISSLNIYGDLLNFLYSARKRKWELKMK